MYRLILFVVFSFATTFTLSSQDKQLPESIRFSVTETSEQNSRTKLDQLKLYNPDELIPNSKWMYYLTKSSSLLYLRQDSALIYFLMAHNAEPISNCRVMSALNNSYSASISNGHKDSTFSWYLWDLPDFDEYAFIDSCNQKYPPKQLQAKKKASTAISEKIEQRDQKYRSTGDLEKQHVLDQINRDYVDSLYASRGTLSEFEEEEIYQFSMVAHHSSDCDWVYKWTERFIDLYMSGYKGKMLLGPLLDRMLHPNDGYCTKQDAQKRAYFIYMMEDKYPGFFEGMHLSW